MVDMSRFRLSVFVDFANENEKRTCADGSLQDEYIVQIARFDPSKGIFDMLKAYTTFHALLGKAQPEAKPPKLLICGHGSVDDPDGAVIYDAVIEYLQSS